MKEILIISRNEDSHTMAVEWALRKKKVSFKTLKISEFPHKQTHDFTISGSSSAFIIEGESGKIDLSNISAVWYRRASSPALSKDILHSEDVVAAEKLCLAHYKSMLAYLNNKVNFFVNRIESASNAHSKILQLDVAARSGFKVPETLVSNNPESIKKFLSNEKRRSVIFKDVSLINWYSITGKSIISRTRSVTNQDLPEDSILKSSPAIFQIKVPKLYEIRTVIFGREIFSVKINSQNHPCGEVDWRDIPPGELSLELYDLPRDIVDKCYDVLDDLGLSMGCFDIIYSVESEFLFIEVNEQGQFLWMEDALPELPLLDTFCDFLISENIKYKKENKESREVLTMDMFYKDQIEA